eukprot:GFYU01007305.1.p1 GENE.GFYU01007305.1~~GFYU01007305.1.p1  ORF type:complete len:424 (-),score=137.17 GFYU01007305.1:143-1414(-)
MTSMDPPSQSEPRGSGAHDKYGFVRSQTYGAQEALFEQNYAEVRGRRQARWEELLTKFDIDFTNDSLDMRAELKGNKKLKALIRKGIPGEMRKELWLGLSGAHALLRDNPGAYSKLVQQGGNMESEAVKQIEMDLHRTFPGHKKFETTEGIDQLRRVLTAYSVRNPDIGYCQAMNFITGMLLLFMDEEEAFWMLSTIVELILPGGYFTQTMSAMQTDQRVFSELLSSKLKKVFKHIGYMDAPFTLATQQWFLCLYVNTLPVETTLRVWDSLFFEGSKILFRVGLAIMKLNEKALLATEDIGEVIQLLKSLPRSVVDCEALMKMAFNDMQWGSFPMSKIEELRAKHGRDVDAEFNAYQEKREARMQQFEEENNIADDPTPTSTPPPQQQEQQQDTNGATSVAANHGVSADGGGGGDSVAPMEQT